MTVHLASEILRLIFQQVVIWVWNYGMVNSLFFLEQFKVKLSLFISLIVSKLHILTLQTILTIYIHVNAHLLY